MFLEEYGVLLWWGVLSLCAVANLYLAFGTKSREAQGYAVLWTLAALSTGWFFLQVALKATALRLQTVACAVRSFLPRIDVERVCFIPTMMSYPCVGRSLATVGELLYGFQVVAAVDAAALASKGGRPWGAYLGNRIAFALLCIAEACSWYGVATRRQIWNGIEESLWALSCALLLATVLAVKARGPASGKWSPRMSTFLRWFPAVAAVFLVYMVLVDVPMYLARYSATQDDGVFLSLADGLRDSCSCHEDSKDWATWAPEIWWMTPYFTVGVWSSVWLVTPMAEGKRVKAA